jgi:hypothetical protein
VVGKQGSYDRFFSRNYYVAILFTPASAGAGCHLWIQDWCWRGRDFDNAFSNVARTVLGAGKLLATLTEDVSDYCNMIFISLFLFVLIWRRIASRWIHFGKCSHSDLLAMLFWCWVCDRHGFRVYGNALDNTGNRRGWGFMLLLKHFGSLTAGREAAEAE